MAASRQQLKTDGEKVISKNEYQKRQSKGRTGEKKE